MRHLKQLLIAMLTFMPAVLRQWQTKTSPPPKILPRSQTMFRELYKSYSIKFIGLILKAEPKKRGVKAGEGDGL